MADLKFLLEKQPIKIIEKEEVLKNIPHREPMLFVDAVRVVEENKFFVGVKTFAAGEEFYKGHYPNFPITPGVFLVESMGQCFGAAAMGSPMAQGKIPLFIGIEEAKFRTPVKPGEQILMPIEVLRLGKISRIYAEAYVGGVLCASAKLNFILGDK